LEKKMNVNSHGRNLYYELHGHKHGPVLVLLHHGLGSVYSWEEQIPALVEAGYCVLVYDRWGYGSSDPRPSLSVPDFNEDVLDLRVIFENLKISKASLIGHSDGGVVALKFAARYPEKVRSIVVVAAHIYVEEKMITGIMHIRDAYKREERFREGMQRIHGEKADQVFHNWFDGWVKESNLDWDLRPFLSAVPHPVLVVQGVEDEHALPQHARDLAVALPNAELWLLDEATHMLPQDFAGQFNPKMLEFLGKSLKFTLENNHV
jgi:pimeloyl-ACP methyl ester carboxylesterase